LNLYNYLIVGGGGALGAMTRVALSHYIPPTLVHVPLAILCINIIGCLAMGMITEIFTIYGPLPNQWRYFIVSGFLGGFTTFSAFALECGILIEKSDYLIAGLYVFLNVVLCLTAYFIGLKIVKIVI